MPAKVRQERWIMGTMSRKLTNKFRPLRSQTGEITRLQGRVQALYKAEKSPRNQRSSYILPVVVIIRQYPSTSEASSLGTDTIEDE